MELKSFDVNPLGDPAVLEKLQITVPNLINVKSIEQLRNPEFCFGEHDGEGSKKIKDAILQSKECKGKCQKWLELCKNVADGKKASDDDSLIDEEILAWLKTISYNDPQASEKKINSQSVTRQSLSDKSGTESKDKETGGRCTTLLQKLFPSCFKTPKTDSPSKGQEDCVHITMMSGTILILQVSQSDTVKDLKEKICTAQGIDPSLQYLIHNKTVLKDTEVIKDLLKPTNDQAPSRMIYLIQLRSVLGVPKGTTVDMDLKEPQAKAVKFSKEEFEGLYMWYTNRRKEPDVYRGEFKNGERASAPLLPPAAWHRDSNRPRPARAFPARRGRPTSDQTRKLGESGAGERGC